MQPRKPDAQATRALIRELLLKGRGYKQIIEAAHARGLGCSTQQIRKMKVAMALPQGRGRSPQAVKTGDALINMIGMLKGMGITELHYKDGKLTVHRVQTMEITDA